MQKRQISIIHRNPFRLQENGLLWGLAGIKLALFVLAGNSYDYHPIEYYLIACSQHIDWGYFDIGPFSVYLLWLIKSTLGLSLFAMRLLPALAGAATVYLTGKLVKDMGGCTFAVTLAATAIMLTPFALAAHNLNSPHAYTMLFVVIIIYILVHILDEENYFYWLPLGGVIGLAVLNHHSSLVFIPGIFIGIILTKYRTHYKHKEIWYALLLIICILLPHITWQIDHQWPVIEMFSHYGYWKNSDSSPLIFLKNQLVQNNPIVLLFCITGVLAMWLDKSYRESLILFWIFFTALVLLFITGLDDGKSLLAFYPLLLVMGVLYIDEHFISKSGFWKPLIMTPLIITGLLILPFCLSVLPINGLKYYINQLGDAGIGLDSIYAKPFLEQYDRQIQSSQWLDNAARDYSELREIYPEHPPVLFADDKYLSAEIDFHRRKFNYQRPVSGQTSWWIWGPGQQDGPVLYIGESPIPVKWYDLYNSITPVDTLEMNGPFLFNNRIFIYQCLGPVHPLYESWVVLKKY